MFIISGTLYDVSLHFITTDFHDAMKNSGDTKDFGLAVLVISGMKQQYC